MPDILLRRDPTPGSYSAKPLTALEIDAHPDGDRIWATLKELEGQIGGRVIPNQTYRKG